MGILSGSAVAQALALAAVPILSRLYTPEDAAHYALVLSAAMVVASFASLRLDLAIPLPEDVGESRQLFWVSALLPILIVPLVATVAWLLSATSLQIPIQMSLLDYVTVGAFVVVLCLFAAGSQLAVRLRAYGVLARIPILQMVGTLVAQVALGFVGFGRGLFTGALFGRSLGFASLFYACQVHWSQTPPKGEVLALLRRYWRFPVIFAPASLVNVLGSSLSALMLPALLGLGPAGLYAMSARVAAVPAGVLSDSAGQVFMGEFARAQSRRDSLRVFFRWSGGLFLLGLAVATAVWVVAPVVLPWVLGDDWAGTDELAQYAGVMAGAGIFGSPLHAVWIVRQRGLILFSWNVLRLVATGGVIWLGAAAGDSIFGIARSLALVTVLVYFIGWLGCLIAAVRKPADLARGDVPLSTAGAELA